MSVLATKDQVRALAYRLCEEAGGPDGHSDDFWIMRSSSWRANRAPETTFRTGRTQARKAADPRGNHAARRVSRAASRAIAWAA